MTNFSIRPLSGHKEPTAIESIAPQFRLGLGILCFVFALIGFVYCVTPADANGLVFTDKLPDAKLTLRLPEKKPEGLQKVLAEACQTHAPGDEKCVCVNNAIYRHDSGWATAGVGKKTRNPGNMRVPSTWKPSVPFEVYHSPGNGVFSKFKTLEDGIVANVELYARLYQDLSAPALVSRWADGGGDRHYRSAVSSCYAS